MVSSKRRITLVAEQLLGYFRTGGLGTATTFLALALARIGHDVEVLFFGDVPAEPANREWTQLYEGAGVGVRPLERSDRVVEPTHFARMREIELALGADPPDVVIAQDLGAPAYSAQRLQRLGLAFENTLFVVFCHGSRQWIANMARKVRVLPGALAVSRLEQASVELADVVVSPSAYMVEWMRAQRWRLPDTTLVIPLLTRAGATGEPPPAPLHVNGERPIERIAFFGRLEERKGVRPFVAGVNALPAELLERIELQFLGRETAAVTPADVEALLSDSARNALRHVSFETDLDQHEALARLSRPGTLAVVPSLEDNSPNVVYECLERGIPFLASGAGGTSELVAPDDRERVLFEPTPAGVAAALRRALCDPPRPARPAFDDAVSLQRWSEVVAMRPRPVSVRREQPVVAVVKGSAADRAAAVEESEAAWVLFLDEQDVPEPDLLDVLVRAQAASAADVVTCGLRLDGRERFFSGEPGGLGLLSNDYGTVALIRRAVLDDVGTASPATADPDWPLLARLSARGARIVSVPLPLVTRTRAPGTLERNPSDALLVVDEFERSLPDRFRALARLAAGLAAETQRRPPAVRRSLVRRLAHRLLQRAR